MAAKAGGVAGSGGGGGGGSNTSTVVVQILVAVEEAVTVLHINCGKAGGSGVVIIRYKY